MGSPFNPFAGAGRGQRGGPPTGATSRGRGASSNRGSQLQSQTRGSSTSGTFRGPSQRGRGRGTGAFPNRGRGAGAAAGGAGSSHSVTSTQQANGHQNGNSPFAPINQQKPFSSPFGGQSSQPTQPQKKSPFPPGTNGAPAPSSSRARGGPRGGARGGAPRHNQWIKPARKPISAPGQPIPVEDTSIMARYQQRYEQVSTTSTIYKNTNLSV